MTVYVVEIRHVSRFLKDDRSIKVAVLEEDEESAVRTVAKLLAFPIQWVEVCYPAFDQTAYGALKPQDPKIVWR